MGTAREEWLLASIVRGRTVGADEEYPHICGRRYGGRRTTNRDCAACFQTDSDRGPVRVGNGGHECRPAGRGADPAGWTCTVCSADWRAVTAVKAGVTTITWERKMTERQETR